MHVNSICHYPFDTVRVSSDGSVYTCEYQREPIGNLFQSSFEDIWFSEKAENIRQNLVDAKYADICCVDCPFYSANQKSKQSVGYSEYPAVLELFDEMNEPSNFIPLLAKIKDYKEIVIDFKYHNIVDWLPSVPITMNLYEPIFPDYVNTFRIMECLNFTQYRFIPNKKYICRFTFGMAHLNKICDIIQYFLLHPFSIIECDVKTTEIDVSNCGLFKRAESILRNRFKQCKIIRPFDLNLSQKYLL